MSEKNMSVIEQVYEDWKKKVGHMLTSEEERAQGPEYMRHILNTEVTLDGIRHYVDAVGDLNPLYRDPEYAKRTKYKCLIAPPVYIYSIKYSAVPEKWPLGIMGFYSGSTREWFRPLCEGDKITYKAIQPSDIQIQPSRFAGQKLLEYSVCDYFRQGGELIAGYKAYETWADLERIKEQNKYGHYAEDPEYTEEYIKKVYEAQDNEKVRGAEPRYWEDVEVGDKLTPVVRGPFTHDEHDALCAALRGYIRSHRLTRLEDERDPGGFRGIYDPRLKIYLRDIASQTGFNVTKGRRFVAAGQQVEAWRSMVLTNWMGDDGFLWRSSSQIRLFTMSGDVIWCKGKVKSKYCDHGRYCVDTDCWCENQRGDKVLIGTDTVILPSREHGPVVYPEPHSWLAD